MRPGLMYGLLNRPPGYRASVQSQYFLFESHGTQFRELERDYKDAETLSKMTTKRVKQSQNDYKQQSFY